MPYRVSVKDVEMVPAALRRKLLQVDPDAVVRWRGLDEPGALRVHRVVAHRVG